MAVTFAKGNQKEQAAGTWWGTRPVMIRCPSCKGIAHISRAPGAHHIFTTGEVQPSLVCPNDGCSFHEYVILEDWSDGTHES